jgi:hypothetical protein
VPDASDVEEIKNIANRHMNGKASV